jgi:Uma2 family endonuclease
VVLELPFRSLPEYELRAADVAVLAPERRASADDNDALPGAPEIVIEVLSRSNAVSEIAEYCALCLENGAREFWTSIQSVARSKSLHRTVLREPTNPEIGLRSSF